MTPTILSASDLLADLQTRGVNLERCWVADNSYAFPSLEWVHDVLAPNWKRVKRKLGIEDFESESRDCDDFALMCAAWARMWHSKTTQRPLGTGFGFGVCWFSRKFKGRHALDHFWHMHIGELKLTFFEPQAGKIVYLTDDEIKGAQFMF